MTKYEWESELKRNIHRLPKSEQDRALEFYNELFEDRIESGWTETQIIAEFGNPCDVADKILAEYDESAADSGDDASATRLSSVNTPYGPGDARRPDNAADAPAAEDCGQTPPTAAAPESAPPKTSGRGFFDRLLGVAVRLVKAAFRIAGFVIRWGLWVAAALVTAGGALLLLGGAAVAVLALSLSARTARGRPPISAWDWIRPPAAAGRRGHERPAVPVVQAAGRESDRNHQTGGRITP